MKSFTEFLGEEAKFRRVSGQSVSWYTHEMKVKDPIKKGLKIDVHKEDSEWVVSYREDYTLMRDEIRYRFATFSKVDAAKKFAAAVVKGIETGASHMPNPETFEKYAYGTHGFEKGGRWKQIVDYYKEIK